MKYFSFLCLALSLFILNSNNAWACQASNERCIFNHIMNHEFGKAQKKAEALNTEKALIPSQQFYQGLIHWQNGLVEDNKEQRALAIDTMLAAVDTLKPSLFKFNNEEKTDLLGYALAAGHTARILLYEKEYTKGVTLGKKALDAIYDYRESDKVNAQGIMATNILLGIVAFYKTSAPDYIKKRVRRIVNLSEDQSRRLLETSAVTSEVFGDEAKRILLMEASWSFPRVCGYLPWARRMTQKYDKNPDFSLTLQGLLLRCGQANLALDENKKAIENYHHTIQNQETLKILKRAKWRALANLGETKTLDKILQNEINSLSKDDVNRLKIALADAFTIQQEQEKAMAIYSEIINNQENNDFKDVAKKRLRFGFKAPTPYQNE